MTFRAVEWIRGVRDRHHEETRNMSVEERRDYYKNKSEALLARLRKSRGKTRKT